LGGGGFGRAVNPEMRFHTTVPIESRGGLRLGPPGRWWDDKTVARTVGLDSRQQHRMDDVFNANRDNLLTLYKNLQREEAQLEKTTRSRELDENQIFQQIDRVTQARGELEKATAHTLLLIRKEMTPDQTAKLDVLAPQLDPVP
jgi:Spy/CpxP family protein refolding chaperone